MAKEPKSKLVGAPSPEAEVAVVEVPGEEVAVEPRKYGYGYIADKKAIGASTRAMFGAPINLPNEASLEKHVRRVKDQGQTSSCVGQAVATAIDVRLRAMGVSYPEPSSIGAYTLGRTLYRSSASEGLQDEGSRPFNVVSGLREFGIPTEEAWPFDPYRVNDELPFDVMLSANKSKIGGLYKVATYGGSRSQDVRLALSKGYPLIFALEVDQAFEDHKGAEPIGQISGKVLGGHMLCLVGYRTVNGVTQFRGVNSWGNGWGDNGFFWLSEARLYSVTDIYAVEIQG